VMAALFVASLRIFGVRDWRCYGVALVWLPTLSAVQTANLSLPLLFALALTWRYRDGARGAVALGAAVAAKVILWPLAVWLLATRRLRRAAEATATAVALVVVPWAILRFRGIGNFWELTHELQQTLGTRSYTPGALLDRLHVEHAIALGMIPGVAVLALAAYLGYRGSERQSFSLAVLASLLLAPVAWLHYFVLLAAPIAISRPRFSPAWLLPLVLWACPTVSSNGVGGGGSVWQVSVALAVAVVAAVGVGVRADAGLPPHTLKRMLRTSPSSTS